MEKIREKLGGRRISGVGRIGSELILELGVPCAGAGELERWDFGGSLGAAGGG